MSDDEVRAAEFRVERARTQLIGDSPRAFATGTASPHHRRGLGEGEG